MAMAPKGTGPKKAGAAGAESKAAMEFPEWAKTKIKDVEDYIALANKTGKPVDIAKANKEYEELVKALSTDLRVEGRQLAPNAKTITYDMGNGKFTSRPRGEPAPEGGKAINYTEEQVRNLLPPKPVAPINSAAATEAPKSRSFIDTAKELLKSKRETPNTVYGEVPRATRQRPWDQPGVTPRLQSVQPEALTPRVRDLFDPALVLGAGTAGMTFFDPNVPKTIAQNILKPPYKPQGETNPNLDNLQGPGVSYSPEDFNSDNIYANNPDFNPHMWNPPVSSARPYSGRENPRYYRELPDITPPTPPQSGREHGGINDDDYIIVPPDEGTEMSGGDARYKEPAISYDASDFASNNVAPNENFKPDAWRNYVSTARQVIQRAQNSPAAQAQKAAAILQQSPNELTVQKGADQGPNALTRFIRGDFREGADQRIMEAMRRQREESGVDSSTMARGGAAPKKSSKDDVLHKALEIIHHMLTRR